MFQLLISVLAIALTSTLAVASLHSGETILSQAKVKANVAALIEGGQEIGSAVVLASLDDPYRPISIDRIPSIPLAPHVAAPDAGWQLAPEGLAYIRLDPHATRRSAPKSRGLGALPVRRHGPTPHRRCPYSRAPAWLSAVSGTRVRVRPTSLTL